MKRLASVFLSVLLVGGTVFAAGQSDSSKKDETFKIKCGIMVSKDYSHAKGAKYFADRIKEETKGRVIVEVFTDGVLGSEQQMSEAIQAGALDMSVLSPVYLGNFLSQYQVYDLPYLFKDRAHRDAVVNGPVGAQLDKVLEEKAGFVVLGHFGGTGRILISKKKKIEMLEDLKGVKMRVYASPVVVATWTALGPLPVTVAYAEVYTALQAGVAEAAENESSTLITQRWYEPCKYVTMTEHTINTRPFVIGAKQFSKLPPDIQDVFRKVGKETAEYAVKVEREDDDKYLAQLKQFGIEILQLKDKANWIEATKSVRIDWAKKNNQEKLLQDIAAVTQ